LRYSLNTTHKCNWNCSYCIVDTHNQPARTIEEVYKDVMSLPDRSELSLAGGEPGLLERQEIEKILEISREKNFTDIDLLTNGLFIEKYQDMLHNFSDVHYHCVESLQDTIQFPDLSYADYTIVVTEDEYQYLPEFLDTYPHITFSIIGSMNVKPMTYKTKLKMIKKFKHRMTKRSISENLQENCNSIGY